MRFDNLLTFSGQNGEDLIQPTELQGLQRWSNPTRETTHSIVEISQTN